MFHRRMTALVLALPFILPVMAVGQSEQDDTPQRPRQRAPMRGRQFTPEIDPAKDGVITTIKAAVSPSEEQMSQIIELYTKLRQDQRGAFREVFRGMRGRQGEAGERAGRPDRREVRTLVMKKIEPLNAQFLADCRSLLGESQLEGWDSCAAGLELMPRQRGPGGRMGEGGPKVGDMAPAFELTDIAGKTVTLASLRGKPVVLEFGSYTCPVFRRKVDDVEELRREFGDAVRWVMIYTKEAHPTDGWVVPMNTRLGIEFPQHTSFTDRLECAKERTEKMALKMHVVVDGIENKVTEAYSGHPNRGYVIDAEGKVVSRQVWIDVEETRKALEKVMSNDG